MIYYDNETRQFAVAKDNSKNDPKATRIGTLSVGILTRKRVRDRKGRKRRVRVEFDAPLMGGNGAMTPVAAISNLKKELGNIQNRNIKLNPKSFRKITEAFKSSEK